MRNDNEVSSEENKMRKVIVNDLWQLADEHIDLVQEENNWCIQELSWVDYALPETSSPNSTSQNMLTTPGRHGEQWQLMVLTWPCWLSVGQKVMLITFLRCFFLSKHCPLMSNMCILRDRAGSAQQYEEVEVDSWEWSHVEPSLCYTHTLCIVCNMSLLVGM